MAKYKVGDKVRIVSERPQEFWNPEMDKYLGKTMTIAKSGTNYRGVYYHMEDDSNDSWFRWYWYEDMIAGLAEQKKPAEQKGDNNMKTETNLYLRSLCGEKKSALREAHDEELRKLNDALTALRTEESQKQPPALSEKTVDAIRNLLDIHLNSANEMLGQIKCILSFAPVGKEKERDEIIQKANTKVSEATTALNEFNAAYPAKKSK